MAGRIKIEMSFAASVISTLKINPKCLDPLSPYHICQNYL